MLFRLTALVCALTCMAAVPAKTVYTLPQDLHRKPAERTLPTGSVMQGLAKEPHYGHAIGETIFDVYLP